MQHRRRRGFACVRIEEGLRQKGQDVTMVGGMELGQMRGESLKVEGKGSNNEDSAYVWVSTMAYLL